MEIEEISQLVTTSKYIADEIKEDYKQWKKGDLIFIKAGTGTGKSYFIKNDLVKYCKDNDKKILYLTNRNTLKKQIINDIGQNSTITVMNYQKVEVSILNNVRFDNYDYVVMDEAHYFFTDASFSKKTDIFFKKMIADNSICKILMTATPLTLSYFFNKKCLKIDYTYELLTDYSYIDKIVAFNDYNSIDKIIQGIPQDEQIIFFSTAKRAYKVAKKYDGTFICSEHNKDDMWNKYVKGTENEVELNNIIENGCFNNHILCTTTVLDNGINIKEGTKARNIIIDILDIDTFIQVLGRKRVFEGEKINLYFYAWKDGRRINGFRTKMNNTLEMADYLIKNGEIEYTKKKFKTDISDSRIIDSVVIDNGIHMVINECVYTKCKVDLSLYDAILDKKHPVKYKKIIGSALGFEDDSIIEMEAEAMEDELVVYLNSITNKSLSKEEKAELIKVIGLKDGRGRLQKSITQLNAYLNSNKIPFMIISKRIKKDNKLNTIWVIEKLII
ncbi:DEAD/DEAH box helicase family protein [Clostridium tagluense]|uniref:Helicase ATP-binding domain-containing protein n=1 Tax=Clostridium tagluense TaxID=360422 RepID=A0A401UPD0_9CLOT|nr:DEAD/DEAH box helicase family protein [Clostridium tagluense]GCD11405.1 hypothetical protein Ctaglu_30280 [Clostridium tagluense]